MKLYILILSNEISLNNVLKSMQGRQQLKLQQYFVHKILAFIKPKNPLIQPLIFPFTS